MRILYQGDEWGARNVAGNYADVAAKHPASTHDLGGEPETYVVEPDPDPDFSHRVVAYTDADLAELANA